MLPQAMQFAVPGALLLAATSVYGRVSASNEVVAIKALGISPMTLIWPTIGLSCLISLGAVVSTTWPCPGATTACSRVLVESLEEIAYGRLRTMRSFNNDRLKVHVARRGGAATDRAHHPVHLRPTAGRLAHHGRRPPSCTPIQGRTPCRSNWSTSRAILRVGRFRIRASLCGRFPWTNLRAIRAGERTPSNYALSEIGPAKIAQTAVIAGLKSRHGHRCRRRAADGQF